MVKAGKFTVEFIHVNQSIADAVAIALCHARSFTSRLQSPDAARPGSGRYEVRKQVR